MRKAGVFGSLGWAVFALQLAVFPPFLASQNDSPGQAAYAGQDVLSIPSLEEIKNSLFASLNAERTARNLRPLRYSAALERLALRQSEDMAALGLLTHASATGQTYAERLFAAKFYYRANGENVARSGTFLPNIIHQSFMNSPPHRENVLNPDFDEVGIGVVQTPDRTYYVTQDFLRSLVCEEESEVRNILLRGIRDVLVAMSLPPLEWSEAIDAVAQAFALSRAAGNTLRGVPDEFRGGRVSFAFGPDLAEIAATLGKKSAGPFVRGGLGVCFDRTKDYPGGAYYICAILLPAEKYAGLGPKSLADRVLKAANAIRVGKRLARLFLDKGLNRAASAIRIQGRQDRRRGTALSLSAFETVFETPDLSDFPASLIPALEDSSYRKIGIAVSPVENKWRVIEHFVVAVVLDR